MTPTSSKATRGVYSPGFDSALAKCFEMLLNLPPTDTSASICLFVYLFTYFEVNPLTKIQIFKPSHAVVTYNPRLPAWV